MSARINRIRGFLARHSRKATIAGVAFLILALVLVPTSFSFARRAGSAETGLFGLPILENPQASADTGGEIDSDDIRIDSNQGIPLPEAWDGAERVTILVMGLDYRDWSSGDGPSRTDSMMLVSVDPVAGTAGVLSIPRDLWAVIPGFNPNKINTAYYFGELYSVPGGGPGLAMRTVEQTIGIPIDYYAQIDFSAFIRFIDLIGGVKIDIPQAITVDPLGADTIPKNLKPGVQTLPGEVALAYARERHAPGGDFARAQRQQQILIGVRDRILEFNLLPGLIANANQLYAELSSGVNTNLPLEDAIRLAVLALQIEEQDIRQGVISEQYVTFGRSPDDLSILIPIPDKIRALRDEIFTSSSGIGPLVSGSAAEQFAAEGASISIQNGTADAGLGDRTRDYLNSQGGNIIEVRPAQVSYSQTVIVDHTGSPYTLAYLATLMDISSARIIHEFDPNSSVDVEIRLGSDWANNNSLP